jgi:hypothetical protein
VEGCNQRASLQSGDDLLCGDHWKMRQERQEAEDALESRLSRIDEAKTLDDLRPLLRELVERSFN